MSPRVAPLSPDYTLASPDYTLDTPYSDEDLEPLEVSETRNASPSGSTSPLSHDPPLTLTSPTSTSSRAFYYRSIACMAMRTQPTLSPGISAKVIEVMSLSPPSFHKSKTESEESEDEGIGSNSEEAAPKGQQQLPTHPTWFDPKDGTVYMDIEFDGPPVHVPVQTPASPDWSSGSLPVSPASLTIPSPLATPVSTLAATIAVDEDEFIEARFKNQREIHALRMQQATDHREIHGLRERVATLERKINHFER
ncbi:hypothetical protein Tco_1035852 [Tanacetum coccineum]